MRLSDLKPPRGARSRRKRVGRGPGSTSGKTAGRGSKGQLSRSGGTSRPWFEGGQMPLQRRVPKRGFVNPRRREYQIVNVGQLTRFEPSTEVDFELLCRRRLAHRRGGPVKILGHGDLGIPLTVRASAFSKTAREKIVAQGGTVEVTEECSRASRTSSRSRS